MQKLRGVGVSPGTVVAPVVALRPRAALPEDTLAVGDVVAAMAQLDTAVQAVSATLTAATAEAGAEVRAVLEAQVLILQDPILRSGIQRRLEAGLFRAAAVAEAFAEFREQLMAAGPYFAERVDDLDDLSYRLRATLLGVATPPLVAPKERCVLVAEELAPADLVVLGSAVVGLVTQRGGATGHTAIVAKSMGVAAVVGCPDAADIPDGTLVLVDGREGLVVVDPTAAIVEQRLADDQARRARADAVSGPGRTADGSPVALLANLGADYGGLAALDCEGVGLFRTEFLYLERSDAPSFDEQFAAYVELLTAAAGRRVVLRTLDAGADKPLRFVSQAQEPNPALGVRGFRVVRHRPDLVDEQLRAIAAAAKATEAEVAVMAPMVSTVAEVRAFVQMARGHGLTDVGVMAEVPALVLAADHVLAECDFVSIGTNDLAQYTFAADRLLDHLSELLDPWQPALLSLIAATAEAGRRHSRPVSVCGEAASDSDLAPVLVGLGVSSLSMAPVSIPVVRAALAEKTMDECRRLAEAVLRAPDAAGARRAVQTG